MQSTDLPAPSTEPGVLPIDPPMLLLDDSYIHEVITRVRKAKRSIWIAAYTWQWFANSPEKDLQQFNTAVVQAARTGLDVRALLHRADEAKKISALGIKAKTLPTQRTMHTKAILIDGELLIIGSHNLTSRGTRANYECSLLIQHCTAVTGFSDYFERMWGNYAV